MGGQLKLLLFWVRDFCGYILGVTSIFDYFLWVISIISCCYLCSVTRFTQLLNMMVKVHNRSIFIRFC